jgi:hypothetical protein
VSGEQDGRFEFAGTHVVGAAAAYVGRASRFRSIFTARAQPDSCCTIGVRLLYDVGQNVVAAVTIHHNERFNSLLAGQHRQ